MARRPTVFISHTTRDPRDLELAQTFAKGLKDRGAQVWIAPESIPVGAKWHPEIINTILEKCTDFVVIISAAAVDSSVHPNWVLREIDLAKQRSDLGSDFTIIPVVVGRVPDYPGREFLEKLQALPYYSDLAEQMAALANALRLPALSGKNLRDYARRMLDWQRLRPLDQFRVELSATVNAEPKTDAKPLKMSQLLGKSDRLVISGSPGGGKTTFLLKTFKSLLIKLQEGLNAPGEPSEPLAIPIYTELGLFTPHKRFEIVILEELALLPSGDALPIFRNLLASNLLVLFLDGLNELSENLRETCIQELLAFDRHLASLGCRAKVRIVVSTE
jgi:hypothetical protein